MSSMDAHGSRGTVTSLAMPPFLGVAGCPSHMEIADHRLRSSDRPIQNTRDPTYPELGTWWELPGGGVGRIRGCTRSCVDVVYSLPSEKLHQSEASPFVGTGG
jgi:hypothetical protein